MRSIQKKKNWTKFHNEAAKRIFIDDMKTIKKKQAKNFPDTVTAKRALLEGIVLLKLQ